MPLVGVIVLLVNRTFSFQCHYDIEFLRCLPGAVTDKLASGKFLERRSGRVRVGVPASPFRGRFRFSSGAGQDTMTTAHRYANPSPSRGGEMELIRFVGRHLILLEAETTTKPPHGPSTLARSPPTRN
jgi:hypothetical protein